MSALVLDVADEAARLGLKGPRAAEWLQRQGAGVPPGPNRWQRSALGAANRIFVARLGHSEFFVEDEEGGAALVASSGSTALGKLADALAAEPDGVYPVLREDFAFRLGGTGVHDVLAQVCNVNFAALDSGSQPVVMTLMIGVAVLAVAEDRDDARQYRFWCDPTFGPYVSEALGAVVVECSGTIRGVTA